MRPHRKPLTWLLAVSGLCALPSVGSGCITSEAEAVSQHTSPSGMSVSGTETFIDELAPYGQWLAHPKMELIWQPSPSVVGPDFIPYATGGQWVHSNEGWTFVSERDFIQPNVYIYRLPREHAQTVYHHASPIQDRGSRSADP